LQINNVELPLFVVDGDKRVPFGTIDCEGGDA
jgi:hypothetical protein